MNFPCFKKKPNISLHVEYSRTLIWFFEDCKFAYKTTKFYPKWIVSNFGQKHKLQYLEKFAMYSRDFKFFMQWTVKVTIFKGQIKAGGTHTPNPWSVFPAYLVGELRCGFQPTAPTCVVWSWRLIDCFALTTAVGGFWEVGFHRSLPPFIVCRFVQSHYNYTSKERRL